MKTLNAVTHCDGFRERGKQFNENSLHKELFLDSAIFRLSMQISFWFGSGGVFLSKPTSVAH